MSSLLPKRTVPEIEARLTELVETDIYNGEIYELLKQLAFIWVFQNKYTYGYSDIESVCHDVAADTYVRVLEGRTEITKWMYYIGRSLKLSYVANQKKVEHEVFDTNGNPQLREAVITMCAGSAKSISNTFTAVQKVTFLENIDALIRKAVSTTKFKRYSKEWWQIYTSVCISLNNNKIVYFRVDDKLKPYVQYVYDKFKDMFSKSEFMEPEYEAVEDDLPALMFYDEEVVKNVDKRRDC